MKQFIKVKTTLKNNKYPFLAALFFVPFYIVHGCPLRELFGICCPCCGLSRAVWSIITRLDFESAVNFHPLVVLIPVALAVWFFRRKMPKKVFLSLFICAFVLLITVYVMRLVSGSEYVYIDFARSLIYKIFQK